MAVRVQMAVTPSDYPAVAGTITGNTLCAATPHRQQYARRMPPLRGPSDESDGDVKNWLAGEAPTLGRPRFPAATGD